MANVTFASGDQMMCTQQYQPVCGYVQVQCIKAPCYPVPQTFGNACEAANAHAINVTEGECDGTPYNRLANTSWTLQSFNNSLATAEATLTFDSDSISAKVCNSKNGSYEVSGNKLMVGAMMSTLMYCEGAAGTYETAFDLSGATYELSTDGANHLMITTVKGDSFQWVKKGTTGPKPNPRLEKRYGFLFWQIHQIEKLKGYDSIKEKQEFVSSLMQKIDDLIIKSLMTPLQNASMKFLRDGLQYYYDHMIS